MVRWKNASLLRADASSCPNVYSLPACECRLGEDLDARGLLPLDPPQSSQSSLAGRVDARPRADAEDVGRDCTAEGAGGV